MDKGILVAAVLVAVAVIVLPFMSAFAPRPVYWLAAALYLAVVAAEYVRYFRDRKKVR